jgi:hypothetical protein
MDSNDPLVNFIFRELYIIVFVGVNNMKIKIYTQIFQCQIYKDPWEVEKMLE